MTGSDCAFCGIVVRDVPSAIVREDGATLSFLTVEPVRAGRDDLERVARRLRGEVIQT